MTDRAFFSSIHSLKSCLIVGPKPTVGQRHYGLDNCGFACVRKIGPQRHACYSLEASDYIGRMIASSTKQTLLLTFQSQQMETLFSALFLLLSILGWHARLTRDWNKKKKRKRGIVAINWGNGKNNRQYKVVKVDRERETDLFSTN